MQTEFGIHQRLESCATIFRIHLHPHVLECLVNLIRFDEKQSLQLFSSYVNLDAGFLPEEAKLIHEVRLFFFLGRVEIHLVTRLAV